MATLWGSDSADFPSARHWLLLVLSAVACGLLILWVAR